MPYTAGSQGAQTNCAKYFMENALHTALTGAGFTYVEEVVQSTTTSRVYKSSGANNYFGQDWYLLVRRASDTDTTPMFGIAEQYNSTSHLCFNYGPQQSSLTPTAQYAVNDPSGKNPTDNSNIRFINVSVTASGFQYWISTTSDRVIVATRVSVTDYAIYAGLYDDFYPIASSPFPLINVYLAPSTTGGATREPYITTSFSQNFQAGPPSTYNWTSAMPTSDVYTSKIWLSRVLLNGRGTNASAPRGLLRDVWVSPVAGVNGDTLAATIAGANKTLVQMRQGNVSAPFFIDTAL